MCYISAGSPLHVPLIRTWGDEAKVHDEGISNRGLYLPFRRPDSGARCPCRALLRPSGLVDPFIVGLFLERDRRRSESRALAPQKAALGGVGLHHHRELELIALGGERAGLLLSGQLVALDTQSVLQLADPPPHLEPAAGRQAQVGPVLGTLQRIDPGAPQPGLEDLAPKLLFVLKLHDASSSLPFGST